MRRLIDPVRRATSEMSWPYRVAVLLVMSALVAASGVLVVSQVGERTATAYFTQTKSLYEGDDVQMAGVRIGTVERIEPQPGRVRVDFRYDAQQSLPADAKAVIMSPSVVPVRNVTIAPAYQGGPTLDEGATIPIARTAVPVEFDEMKSQLNELSEALGPEGANSSGSVDRLLRTSARNLDGQGTNLNDTVRAMSEAMSTLNSNGGDLFATVRNVRVFVDALAKSDAEVVDFNQRLADVSGILGENRERLGSALEGLNEAFGELGGFLENNREQLAGTVEDLRPVSDLLARNRQQIADLVHLAPTLLSNFYNIYDPVNGSLNGALSLANVEAPALLACSAIYSLGGEPEDCRKTLEPLAKLGSLPPPPVGLSPVERNSRSNTVKARPGPEPPAGSPEARPDVADVMVPGGSR